MLALTVARERDEQSLPRLRCENEYRRMFSVIEWGFVCTMFGNVQNGKFSSKNSIFEAGIEERTEKCIITSGGQNEKSRNINKSPGAYRQGDKGPNNAQPDQKGRDASGASEGAEALIASSEYAQL